MRKQQPSELLDCTPPHNLEAEQAVLGSILLDSRSIDRVSPLLLASDFYIDVHRCLYEHLLNLPSTNSKGVDIPLLVNWLKQAGDLEAIGGHAYLAELAQSVPYAANAVYYAKIVKSESVRRHCLSATVDLIRDIHNPAVKLPDLLETYRNQLDDAAAQTSTDKYPQYTCRQLMAENIDLTYLIEGVLVKNQPCILAGPKKSLKTSLLLDMGIALAKGGCFFGKFRVPLRATVGLMSGESGLGTIQETLKRICATAGYNPDLIDNLIITDRVPQFGDADHIQALRTFVKRNALDVLMIDPVYMAMSGEDAGNLFKQGTALYAVSQLCQEHGCTLILAHHTVKRPGAGFRAEGSPPELEDIAWAGFQEFARQWLLVSRIDPYEPGTGSHRLWLSVGGSAGHGGLWALNIEEGTQATEGGRFWQVDISNAVEARQKTLHRKDEEKKEADNKKLLVNQETLVANMTHFNIRNNKTAIREISGLSKSGFEQAWIGLLAQDIIVSAGDITKGTITSQAYQLASSKPEQETKTETGKLW